MIFKVILLIFAYLLIGIAVLDIMLWHDRKVGFIDKWIDETSDWEQTSAVILWPIAHIKDRILYVDNSSGEYAELGFEINYCPNCGEKMSESEDIES